jgi:methyl-accepting chemotaxis protein
VLQPLHARAEASKAAATKTAEQYAGIRSATDKIVMSLQCDDIARQRLEHVQQGLSQASELERAGDLQACSGIITLQKSQLLSTRDLLSNSLRGFLSSVQTLSSHLEQLTAETTAFANQTDQDGQSIASVMENGLRAVSSVYGQYSASAQAIVSTVEALLPSVSGMSNGANELKKIAASIRRTALNARIETSHLGTEGATLRVLAGEVQQITEDSDDETQSILGHLTAINQELSALSSRSAASGTATTLSANLGEELSALIGSVEKSSQQMSAGLRVLLEKSAALGSKLQETGALAERSIQTAQCFDHVLLQLEGIVQQLGPAPDTAFSSEAPDLGQMYSMQSERDIHNHVFGGAPQPQAADADLGGDVELF